MATKKKRRTFTPEYKAEVVALVQKGGKSVGQIARDLGLTETSVRGWVRQADVDASGGGGAGALTTSEREELAALRRENKTLRMEREVLKKATAFFAKETT